MDQRELDSTVKSLAKAIAEKEPATIIVSILEKLKNDVVPTEELLRVCSKLGYIPDDCMRTIDVGVTPNKICRPPKLVWLLQSNGET